MLLRQTRSESVATIWVSFFERFPDAPSLSRAQLSLLRRILKPLGFGNMRAEALRTMARWVVNNDGRVPDSREKLLSIPHVGAYASNALLSFHFGRRVEIVDGNVQRFVSRFYGIPVLPDIRRNPSVHQKMRRLLPTRSVSQHNYGILDFTATVCKPASPKCTECPLSERCSYFHSQKSLLGPEPQGSRRIKRRRCTRPMLE